MLLLLFAEEAEHTLSPLLALPLLELRDLRNAPLDLDLDLSLPRLSFPVLSLDFVLMLASVFTLSFNVLSKRFLTERRA
jgi:hypothetical protein